MNNKNLYNSGISQPSTNSLYDDIAFAELQGWLVKTRKKPGFINKLTKSTQKGINSLIPEKVHQVITYAIEKMVKGVLFGTKYITPAPLKAVTLEEREIKVRNIIKIYQNTASAEGAITGAGGILFGLVDFPAFLTIKMKMLFEIAAAYGHDVKLFEERLYLLYIFKLTFSSQGTRNQTLSLLENWQDYISKLPSEVSDFDWRDFQLEYRDYLDLVKLAQLIPIIGAGVGAVANYQLANKLGTNAMQCYRLRQFDWEI